MSTNPIARMPGQSAPPRIILQGRYQLERKLGAGGMSTVYLARDMRFGAIERLCAVKEMVNAGPDSATRRLNLENFTREANLLAGLAHPAVPKVYDFFSQDNKSFLVLEYIDGVDLEKLWSRTKEPLPASDVVAWSLQVAEVLAFLHEQQPPIIFRDVKPSNIMLTRQGRIMLIDFGIAKLFQVGLKGTMIGTEGYAPPEQYRGIADARGDIYALGATMHHLLTGRDPRLEAPFTFDERAVRSANPTVSPALEAAVTRALEYEAEKRFATARDFTRALQNAHISIVPGTGQIAPAAASPAAPAPSRSEPQAEARSAGAPAASPAKTAEATAVWKFKCEDEIRSSPRVLNGTLYIGSYDHNLYALDAASGRFLWKYPTEAGIASTPLPTPAAIYLGSEDGTLYALNPAQPQVLWRLKTKAPVRSSPRISGDVLVVGSDDGGVYAVHVADQAVLWRFQAQNSIRSSPLVVDDTVVVGCDDGFLYGIQMRDGRQRWKYNAGRFVISSPEYHEGLIVVGAGDHGVHAVDIRSGWSIWRARTDGPIASSPAIADGRIYIGSSDGNLYALDARSGRVLWKCALGGQVASSPAVSGDLVYVGAEDGSLHAVERRSGQQVWAFRTGGPIASSPCVAGGRVFIGSADRYVYALAA